MSADKSWKASDLYCYTAFESFSSLDNKQMKHILYNLTFNVSLLSHALPPECLYDRVSQETADSAEITQRLSKVNKYICEKIMDINKSIKNEERRESKLLIRQTVKMENFSYDGM